MNIDTFKIICRAFYPNCFFVEGFWEVDAFVDGYSVARYNFGGKFVCDWVSVRASLFEWANCYTMNYFEKMLKKFS